MPDATSLNPSRPRPGLCSLAFLLVAVFSMLSAAGAQDAPGPGVVALQMMLRDKSPEIRIRAAQGLGRVGGRRAVLILRRGLTDKVIEVRIAVVEALGYVGGRLALTVLSEALKDKSSEVGGERLEARG